MKTFIGPIFLTLGAFDYYVWMIGKPGPLEIVLHLAQSPFQSHATEASSWLNPAVAAAEWLLGLTFADGPRDFRRHFIERHSQMFMTREFFERARFWRLAQVMIASISALAALCHLGRTNPWTPVMVFFWLPLLGLNTLSMRYFSFNLPVPRTRMGTEEDPK